MGGLGVANFYEIFGVTEVERCSTLELRRASTLIWDCPAALNFFCPLCRRAFLRAGNWVFPFTWPPPSLPSSLSPRSGNPLLFTSARPPACFSVGPQCAETNRSVGLQQSAPVEPYYIDRAQRFARPVGPGKALPPFQLRPWPLQGQSPSGEAEPERPVRNRPPHCLSPQHQSSKVQPPAQSDCEAGKLQQRG